MENNSLILIFHKNFNYYKIFNNLFRKKKLIIKKKKKKNLLNLFNYSIKIIITLIFLLR